MVSLETGKFTLKIDGYELDGNAVVRNNYHANLPLTIKAGAKLTGAVEGTTKLTVGGTIAFEGNVVSNFYDNSGNLISDPDNIAEGEYTWTASDDLQNTTEPGWKGP
jgi:hypothetical protein